jgi:hypothetical protein
MSFSWKLLSVRGAFVTFLGLLCSYTVFLLLASLSSVEGLMVLHGSSSPVMCFLVWDLFHHQQPCLCCGSLSQLCAGLFNPVGVSKGLLRLFFLPVLSIVKEVLEKEVFLCSWWGSSFWPC